MLKARVAERQNEPRAYRESIAQVFRQLRPNVKVITADTLELEERLAIEKLQLSVVDRAERLAQ